MGGEFQKVTLKSITRFIVAVCAVCADVMLRYNIGSYWTIINKKIAFQICVCFITDEKNPSRSANKQKQKHI